MRFESGLDAASRNERGLSGWVATELRSQVAGDATSADAANAADAHAAATLARQIRAAVVGSAARDYFGHRQTALARTLDGQAASSPPVRGLSTLHAVAISGPATGADLANDAAAYVAPDRATGPAANAVTNAATNVATNAAANAAANANPNAVISAATHAGDTLPLGTRDTVAALPANGLRQQVSAAIDSLQARFQSQLPHDPASPQLKSLTAAFADFGDIASRDVAFAAALTDARRAGARDVSLVGTLLHLLTLSASTSTERLSALLAPVDDASDEAQASGVTCRTLTRALTALADVRSIDGFGAGQKDRAGIGGTDRSMLRVAEAFHPQRIAPFGERFRIALARGWSGTPREVGTTSSWQTVHTPPVGVAAFMRNMRQQVNAHGQPSALHPAFVAEALSLSMTIREMFDSPVPRGMGTVSASGVLAGQPVAPDLPTLVARLQSLCDGNLTVLQSVSECVHDAHALAGAVDALLPYVDAGDLTTLRLPSHIAATVNDVDSAGSPAVRVQLSPEPRVHFDLWRDPAGGVVVDSEVRWRVLRFSAADAEAIEHGAGPESWLQVRLATHVDLDAGTSTAATPVPVITCGMARVVCEIVQRMRFDPVSGLLLA